MTIFTPLTIGTSLGWVKRRMRLLRTHGVSRTVYSAAAWVGRQPGVGRIGHVCVAELFQLPLSRWLTPPRVASCYHVRQATWEDREALEQYFGDPQLIDRRWEQGDVCVVTESSSRLAAGLWLRFGPATFWEDVSALGCCFQIPEATVWTFDGKGTRLGAWGTLMAQLPSLLQTRRITRVVTLIESNNWQSLESHRRQGFQRLAWIARLKMLGCCQVRCRTEQSRWQPLPQRLDAVTVAPVTGEIEQPIGRCS